MNDNEYRGKMIAYLRSIDKSLGRIATALEKEDEDDNRVSEERETDE